MHFVIHFLTSQDIVEHGRVSPPPRQKEIVMGHYADLKNAIKICLILLQEEIHFNGFLYLFCVLSFFFLLWLVNQQIVTILSYFIKGGGINHTLENFYDGIYVSYHAPLPTSLPHYGITQQWTFSAKSYKCI